MSGFIKIDGIDGEARDKNHENWIKIISVGQTVSRPVQIGGDGSTLKGSVECGHVSVVKEVDKSTPALLGAVCKGTKFSEITIDLTTDVGQGERVTYMQWHLENAYVAGYNVSGSADGGAAPCESLSLTYEKIKWTYTPVDKDGEPGGAIPQTWDVGAGKE